MEGHAWIPMNILKHFMTSNLHNPGNISQNSLGYSIIATFHCICWALTVVDKWWYISPHRFHPSPMVKTSLHIRYRQSLYIEPHHLACKKFINNRSSRAGIFLILIQIPCVKFLPPLLLANFILSFLIYFFYIILNVFLRK